MYLKLSFRCYFQAKALCFAQVLQLTVYTLVIDYTLTVQALMNMEVIYVHHTFHAFARHDFHLCSVTLRMVNV